MPGKWLELLKEIVPRVNRVAFLYNPATAPFAEYYLPAFKAAAAFLALDAIVTPVHNTSGSKRCVGISRGRSPPRRSKLGRHASGRSPKMAFR
jgi:ABC-type uncharacterized transport system substrate-binding protein